MFKICTKCHTEKELIEFHKDSSKKDGLQPLWVKDNIRKSNKLIEVN